MKKTKSSFIKKSLGVLLLTTFISQQSFALNVAKEIQDLQAFIQSISFTDNGTPDGNTKVRINGADGSIYGSGAIWIGKGNGNTIYTSGHNVGIGTTNLSEKLNINGNIKLFDTFSIKMGDGNSFIKGNANNISIESNGNLLINNNFTGSSVGIGTNTPGAKLDVNGNIKIMGHYLDANNADSYLRITASDNGAYKDLAAGNLYATTTSYAPIFKDAVDPSYYMDPDGTSYINYLRTSNDSRFPFTNGYNYIRGGTMAFKSTWYDEDNVNYYIDPNNTSAFNNIVATQVRTTCIGACF